MSGNQLLQLALYVGVLVALAKPLGGYMARVYEGEANVAQRVIGPLERGLYRMLRIDRAEEMTW